MYFLFYFILFEGLKEAWLGGPSSALMTYEPRHSCPESTASYDDGQGTVDSTQPITLLPVASSVFLGTFLNFSVR